MQNKKNLIIFISIALVVILKTGLLFFAVFPFQGPDELTHFSIIKYQIESPSLTTREAFRNDYQQLGTLYSFTDIRSESQNIPNFSEYKYSQTDTPKNAVSLEGNSLYYTTLSKLNINSLTSLELLFYFRLLSSLCLFGLLVISYLLFLKLHFSSLQSLLLLIIIGFQPMLSFITSVINIDSFFILFYSLTIFFCFTLLKNSGYGLLISSLLILSFFATLLTKGPGIALMPIVLLLIIYCIQYNYHFSKKTLWLIFSLFISFLIILMYTLVPSSYITTITHSNTSSQFPSYYESIIQYLDKTINKDAFLRAHASYWGNFGWLDTKIAGTLLNTIWLLEYLAYFGVILFLLAKKIPEYLPKKSVILLSLGMILLLQIAIRFYDWRVFDTTGKIVIGTPGRYFLPTILPHFLILVTGLGFLFTKNKSQFTTLLKALALGMILLCLYSIFNVIIPRYYL